MNRRRFLAASMAASALSSVPLSLRAQQAAIGADMHSHWGMAAYGGNGELNIGNGLRAEMQESGMLLVAMKVVADFPQLSLSRGAPVGREQAAPGMLRTYFQRMATGVVNRARNDGLVIVGGLEELKAATEDKKLGIVLSVEGSDFLEGKLDGVDEARAMGVCHLQLVHYRLMEVGDIATQAAKFNGLSDFGKALVRKCNQVGMLVDVAHCNTAGVEQALEVSTKPIVYSHGWATFKEPPAVGSYNARAIHGPLAKRVVQKGGVIGIWPAIQRNPEAYAEFIARQADLLGVEGVGIGTDHSGLPNSAISGYRDFPKIAAGLAKAGMKDAEIAGVLGGNYIRALRQAMTV